MVSGVFLFIAVFVMFPPKVAAASSGTVTVTVRVRPPRAVSNQKTLRGSVFDAKTSVLKDVAMSDSLASNYTQIIPFKPFQMNVNSAPWLGYA